MLFFKKCFVPADVPQKAHATFRKNYSAITKNTDHLFLFACDQKIEHLNKDFYGSNINVDALNPEHVFNIASSKYIGAFATHLGLIARYGKKYPHIPYIVKLNGKTDIVKTENSDPKSLALWTVTDALRLKTESDINICGVGYTLYIGSEYEANMLQEAAQIINHAHAHGLVTILWIYPRGKAIKDDQDPQLIAGACGIAASLGADFVKIKPPHSTDEKTNAQWLSIATQAAGNTRIICSGGERIEPSALLNTVHEQLSIGKTAGAAIGRNIFQRSLKEAYALTRAISMMIYKNYSVAQSMQMFEKEKK